MGRDLQTERSDADSITRRQLLKRSVALGLATPVVGTLLAACGSDDDEPDNPAGESTSEDPTEESTSQDPTSEPDSEEPTEESNEEDPTTESENGDEEPVAEAESWIVAVPDEPNTLSAIDEVISGGAERVQFHIYNGLVDLVGDDLDLVPRLATQWESVSPTEWEFSLRDDVTFHNGDPFTAQDVKATIDYLMNPDNASGITNYGTHLASTVGAEVIDDYTVSIETAEPFPGLISVLPRVGIVPYSLFEGSGNFEGMTVDDFSDNPVGTGPYRVAEWQRGQRITLAAFDDYWGTPPVPAELIFRFIEDATTRVSELRAGGIDITQQLSVVHAQELDEADETDVLTIDQARLIAFPFNTKNEPVNDVRVRQAINYAINKETIVENLLSGYGGVLSQPFVRGWMGYDETIEPYPYDPDRARELLEEAGLGGGFDLDWNITVGAALADQEIAEAVANMVGEVGIRMNLIPTERARIQEDLVSGAFNGITSGGYGTAYEPALITNWFFRRPDIYDDELRGEIMGYLDAGLTEVDLDAREQIYKDFARFGHDQALWMFVHYQFEILGKRSSIPWEAQPWRASKSHFPFLMEL